MSLLTKVRTKLNKNAVAIGEIPTVADQAEEL